MKSHYIILASLLLLTTACNKNSFEHDASGTFEATEIIVSAEATGKVKSLNITEGDQLKQGQWVGYIDSTQVYLKKLQLEATYKAASARRPNVPIQIAATKEQITKALTEKNRVSSLYASGAATQKQLDDADTQLKVLQKTLEAQSNQLSTSVNSLDGELSTVDVQIAQVEDMLAKCRIVNPIEGTVLNKYTQENEVAAPGKALYKIADTKNLFLRAYIISTQLEGIKIGQTVTVFINQADGTQKSYPGKVSWISDKAEFTPKTIQTKDERQNLVYALKIAVENTDGFIKIGMYGDVNFN